MNDPPLDHPLNPLRVWKQLWFEEIPPHVYALLRIVFGVLGFANLVALHELTEFWELDGFVAVGDAGLGIKSFLLARGLGDVAGSFLYFGCLTSFVAMAVGFASGTAVALALAASLVQLSWNYLPLSGAHHAFQAVLFCLVWADCGAVWSVDAWLARRRDGHAGTEQPLRYPIAPLRLIRVQVALIYLSSGLWKLFNPQWRDGSAVHYVLSNNVYHRFPWAVPEWMEGLTTAATYATLFWELGFLFLVLCKPTRRAALLAGVCVHLGMLLFLEIGPFHVVMLSAYIAFLDPERIERWPQAIADSLGARRGRSNVRSGRVQAESVKQAGEGPR